MRSASLLNSLLLAVAFFGGVLVGVFGGPVWKQAVISFAQEQYTTFTYKCDHAMREHLIAKSVLSEAPSIEQVEVLRAAETALIDCNDYDILRKKLIRFGLDDNDLSEMSLIAIEERANSLQQVIDVHEIRY